MSGIHVARNWSAAVSPPACPPVLFVPAQVPSCPSLQRFGVMKANRGVVFSRRRSTARCPLADGRPFVPSVPSGTTFASHSAVSSMMEWNQTKGLCLDVYWSTAVATSAVSVAPMAGCAQSVPRSGPPRRRLARPCPPCPGHSPSTTPHGSWDWAGIGIELVGDGLTARVDTAFAVDLPRVESLIGVGRAGLDAGIGEPVVGSSRPGCPPWRLPGDRGDVVVEAVVPYRVVIL